ncbi:MAG: DUF3429 family protein [Pseudomonadota bacterium]
MTIKPLADDQQLTITHYLYLGLLPFFACALGPWVFADIEAFLLRIFFFYSTMIMVFLAGAIWAIALLTDIEPKTRHIHMAIALSLWPLAAYFINLVTGTTYTLGFMMLGFLLLLFWEKCFINAIYPQWYQLLRHKITFIVVACHMLAIWNAIRVI